MKPARQQLGATYLGDGRCCFAVWAPLAKKIDVRLLTPVERVASLTPCEGGYHSAILDKVEPGAQYFFCLDGEKERPDPASRFQPQGVHGPSQVVDPHFAWQDGKWPREP
ncbi:hypothetical protein BH10PLA2_BH10PLA2_35710 [soil metagenome]